MLRQLSRLRYLNTLRTLQPPVERCLFHTGQINLKEQEYFPTPNEPTIPAYEEKLNEPLKIKRARLLYQSRKRGVSENGLLLATFANKYLQTMDEEELILYDRLINLPSNDWDIYYWITGTRPTPSEFDNKVMTMLKEHVQNKDKESRSRQPDNLLIFN